METVKGAGWNKLSNGFLWNENFPIYLAIIMNFLQFVYFCEHNFQNIEVSCLFLPMVKRAESVKGKQDEKKDENG